MANEGCLQCAHFVFEPQALEREIPGLNIVSSAFGSVRGETGLCRAHDEFTKPRAACEKFAPA